MDKRIIADNFSRRAHSYDLYADIQKRTAGCLLDMIEGNGLKDILEIGCGTGNYTRILRNKFRKAKLKAVDISPVMLEVASQKLKGKKIEFIAGDAEEIDLGGSFGLITSNACFQWFEDLEKALLKYKGLLKAQGSILFSLFGPSTFYELGESLKYISKDLSIANAGFPDKKNLKEILCENFKEVQLRETRYKESFPDLRGLLSKIRHTGIRGEGLKGKFFLGHQALKRLEGFYLSSFGAIMATYQVFYCRGKR